MDIKRLEAIIEAVLFASGEPVSLQKLCEVLDCDKKTVSSVLQNMEDDYNAENRGIMLLKLEDRYQLCTKEQFAGYIKIALDHRRNTPLSQAALEVLSIVAYNQPVTRAYIEQIRGVDCSAVINNLIEKSLVEEKGRLDAPGRPLLFGTTADFLRVFCIKSLSELPKLPELKGKQKETGELEEKLAEV